jgi:acyl carrier protein
MSNEAATWNRLAAVVVQVSDKVRDARDVRPESKLMEDLGLSSLMAVNLVLDLEREFGIIIREQDFDHIHTVGDLKRMIDLRQAGTAP